MQGDILEDIALIENLEETKRTSVEIAAQVKAAKDTEVSPQLRPWPGSNNCRNLASLRSLAMPPGAPASMTSHARLLPGIIRSTLMCDFCLT